VITLCRGGTDVVGGAGLALYHDLRTGHTAWVQRIHAVLFHQGAPAFADLSRKDAPAELAALAQEQLSPAGQLQIGACLRMCEALEAELAAVRRRLLAAARQLRGARVLAESIYGAGPVTALALTCWLGGRRPVHLRPQGGPVRRPRHHRALLRRQALCGSPVPAGPAGAALGGV
jgi:hypothetical protein